jgi:hypothetical protein
MNEPQHENAADIASERWQRLRRVMRARWPKLTPQDVDTIQGNGELAIARICERYGITRDDAERQWAEFSTDTPRGDS